LCTTPVVACVTDDDLSEYLDPELDGAIADADGDESLPAGVTLPRLVVALHVGAAGGLVPFALRAVEAGETGRAALFGAVAAALIASGVVIARIADSRY
jgi:hypothetical protein